MTNIELLLSIIVILLIWLNLLQLQINQNFNKRFGIMGDWLLNTDKTIKSLANWTSLITDILNSYDMSYPKGYKPNEPKSKTSTPSNTEAAKTEARTC